MNMCPSVKGIHQTQDSWCGGSDKNGLKLCGGDLISLLNSSLKEILWIKNEEAPSNAESSSRLKDDVFALKTLLQDKILRIVVIRLDKSEWASYNVGDASGKGYVASVYMGEGIFYVWTIYHSCKWTII